MQCIHAIILLCLDRRLDSSYIPSSCHAHRIVVDVLLKHVRLLQLFFLDQVRKVHDRQRRQAGPHRQPRQLPPLRFRGLGSRVSASQKFRGLGAPARVCHALFMASYCQGQDQQPIMLVEGIMGPETERALAFLICIFPEGSEHS